MTVNWPHPAQALNNRSQAARQHSHDRKIAKLVGGATALVKSCDTKLHSLHRSYWTPRTDQREPVGITAAAAVLAMTLLDLRLKPLAGMSADQHHQQGEHSREPSPRARRRAHHPSRHGLPACGPGPSARGLGLRSPAGPRGRGHLRRSHQGRHHRLCPRRLTEADWDAIPATNKSFAPLAQHRLMHHEDPATAIHERLAPQDGDIIVRKIRYGGMSTTDLDEQRKGEVRAGSGGGDVCLARRAGGDPGRRVARRCRLGPPGRGGSAGDPPLSPRTFRPRRRRCVMSTRASS
jgi:hypothetical protein